MQKKPFNLHSKNHAKYDPDKSVEMVRVVKS